MSSPQDRGQQQPPQQQARYQSVPNPNARAAQQQRGASPLSPAAGRRSIGDASGGSASGSNSAESGGGRSSTAPMIRRDQDAMGAQGVAAGGEYGPYSHLSKGSMGRMGTKPGAGARAGLYQGGAGATLGSDLNDHSSGSAGQRASAYSANSAASSTGAGSSDKYYVPAQQDGLLWDGKGEAEVDDYLHNPDIKRRESFNACSGRGILNVLALFVIVAGLLTLFAGYPIISELTKKASSNMGGFNIGGTNGTGQVPIIGNQMRLVDKDTPRNGLSFTNPDGLKYHAVFTDEFETPGRTFYPGDDPFWEGVDIWYGATGDLEWYSPQQINTTNGYLQLTMEQRPTHNLNFRSGMLQSWNKFCFSGGYIEFSAMLPGSVNAQGWWPGLWTMGNLGRPGYLGTTDGMWPYSYSSCDYGILANQSDNGTPREVATNVKYNKVGLNWLSGQRAPSCTCSGEDHPGPNVNVGRAAPEIDVLEAQTARGMGEASQSFQVAPFDSNYEWDESKARIYDRTVTKVNPYNGGVYQEAVSSVTEIPSRAYELAPDAEFVTFGMEYEPDWEGNGNGMIAWYVDGKRTWSIKSDAVPPRPNIGVAQRLIPVEPMAIILNLGISPGFQEIDYDTLTWPATLKVDYVRVFQRDGQDDLLSCSPDNYPTKEYIERHADVYNNANLTVPKGFPKNSFLGSC